MDLENKTIHTTNQEPVVNTQTKELPAHAKEFGFMGEDMGKDGRMGNYAAGVTNKE